MMRQKKQILIMGAAGRDFHNFNVLFRDNPQYNVIAFTAAQIPFIQNRIYPEELAGSLYPKGIPIYPEEKLPELIRKHKIDEVVFSYSDVSHEYVMHRACLVNSLGADFKLIGSERTMLKSKRPVISVCAVRTGCGKSGVSRKVCAILKELGKMPAAIRHPMPYRDLLKQRVQKFESIEDIINCDCTIEEREEFEPLIEAGINVYAGVDYEGVLREAEENADIIVWDGGNNDTAFIKPDLEIVVLDPHRAGHEIAYYPGEVNFRRGGVFVINKMDTAKKEDVDIVLKNINEINPDAQVVYTSSIVNIEKQDIIKGKKVLVVEDGPTLTHGGMSYGAGVIAAKKFGAKEIVEPLPYAEGTIKETLLKYTHIKNLIPAMGYSKEQIKELEETINKTPCNVVLIATPVNLKNIIHINKPCVRVRYDIEDAGEPTLKDVVKGFLSH
ncbi:MAG TPA: GTPase [Deltaproteobacteria bacterium]|nr:GTPase [Deltaproteobacteria bacterium]